MTFQGIFPVLIGFILIILTSADAQTQSSGEVVVRIVVGGRNGLGISSTIRELIGPATTCENPEKVEDSLHNIQEYTLTSIPSLNDVTYKIKFVEIPGLIDHRTSLEDGQILATLKSYITEMGQPDFFLAISGFDEDRFPEVTSPFVRFLQGLELFNNEYLDRSSQAKMNVVFLLTRFLREAKKLQRSPTKRLDQFWKVIEEHTSMSPSTSSILVGDNDAESLGAPVENGYYQLLNKDYYPKNIWESLISLASDFSDNDPASSWKSKVDVLNALKDNREVSMTCTAKVISENWDEYNSDASAFQYLLENQNSTVEDNEVNLEIDEVFNQLGATSDKANVIIQKTALQLYLQNEGITTRKGLPIGFLKRLEFFQKSSLISSEYPAFLLGKAFGLRMPEYMEAQMVGRGYDVLNDRILESPIKAKKYVPSSAGLQLPSYVKCWKLPVPQTKSFHSYSQNISGYFEERMKYLKFSSKENITVPTSNFSGNIKEGFNISPDDEYSEVARLTAVKEVRIAKCQIAHKKNWDLDKTFLKDLGALKPVNVSLNDSIIQLEGFFEKYGTHIVVESFGGGALTGSLEGPFIKNLLHLNDQSAISEMLTSILEFTKLSEPGLDPPNYKIGEIEINHIYELSNARRNMILNNWATTLNLDFIMLETELSLERISTLMDDPVKAEFIDAAIDLKLMGELKLRVEEELGTSYHRILQSISNQTREEAKKTETQIDYIRQLNEVADMLHRKLMAKLDRKEEIQQRCGGIRALNVRCWNRELFLREGDDE